MKKVLVIDDDADIRESLQALLEAYGFSAAAADGGPAALAMLREGPIPSVILLDLMMPEMDGAEFRRHQLADPAIAGIPVIVISAGGGAVQKARAMGLPGLTKPLDVERLIAMVTAAGDAT
ncbi:MAG: response regulator [Polyangiaceae bacterium]